MSFRELTYQGYSRPGGGDKNSKGNKNSNPYALQPLVINQARKQMNNQKKKLQGLQMQMLAESGCSKTGAFAGLSTGANK